jgi:hypothetical protein
MSLEPWHSSGGSDAQTNVCVSTGSGGVGLIHPASLEFQKKPTKGKSRSGGLSRAELLVIVTNSAKRHARRRRAQPRPGA